MNLIGLEAAAVTFFSVWFGHVAVRKIEFISSSIQLPAGLFAAAGLVCEWVSLSSSNLSASAAFGILGITLLWDALEFTRQEGRVRQGHVPANPLNPRHARILKEYPTATVLNLLGRDPLGLTPPEGTRKDSR